MVYYEVTYNAEHGNYFGTSLGGHYHDTEIFEELDLAVQWIKNHPHHYNINLTKIEKTCIPLEFEEKQSVIINKIFKGLKK